ncbi:MAG: transaldolase, partial [Acidimicrobiales bacterium]
MTKLHELFDQQGQSPWIDNLKRSYVTDGELARLAGEGIRGVTSNPTIFAKAIQGSEDYDEDFTRLVGTMSVEDAYWELVVDDVTKALAILRPLHDSSGGVDGFVSLEVAPSLAHDTKGTIAAARHLNQRIAQPNLYVKIPATAKGVPAIQKMISEGRSINVTLIFSLERYDKVITAYIEGLEELAFRQITGPDAGEWPVSDLSNVSSVASFFVSRVDTEVDRRLETLASQAGDPGKAERILALRGQAAVAQAKLAYKLFQERFSGPRWETLAQRGAKVQRPLWASTSTKNPTYPDLLYVDSLIGPNTVNTMPDPTVEAFLDHGTTARTVDTGVDDAQRTLDALAVAGVDIADVTKVLEDEGVSSFAKSFDEMLQSLDDKANALAAGGGAQG